MVQKGLGVGFVMAVVDGVFAQVAGTVGRVFTSKNGEAFVLEVKREGSEFPDRVTVWGSDGSERTGDRVSVKGWLSWRREVKDDKTYFNVSLNKPTVVEHEPAVTESFGSSDGVPF